LELKEPNAKIKNTFFRKAQKNIELMGVQTNYLGNTSHKMNLSTWRKKVCFLHLRIKKLFQNQFMARPILFYSMLKSFCSIFVLCCFNCCRVYLVSNHNTTILRALPTSPFHPKPKIFGRMRIVSMKPWQFSFRLDFW
jgi:hypothetical protein